MTEVLELDEIKQLIDVPELIREINDSACGRLRQQNRSGED